METSNKTKVDFNSTANQNIKSKFVGIHVYCNVNSLVEYSIKKSLDGDSDAPVQYDEILNMFTYPEYTGTHSVFNGGSQSQLEAEIERLEQILIDEPNLDAIYVNEINEEIEELNNLESEPADIFEWWSVSSFLCDKLEAKGYPVYNDGYNYYWGRTTTGQAILLDGVISEICADMEILEGQASSWA